MNDHLLELLACPHCRRALSLRSSSAAARGRIDEGVLGCPGCDRSFPVVRGIPRLLPETAADAGSDLGEIATVAHFVNEFTALAEGDADIGPLADVEGHFFARTGIDRDGPTGALLRSRRVLDGGCGPGRFTQVAARDASHVVGLELGDHVERAANRCRDLDNVDFVQGSVLRPPLAPASFDYVFTLGVLHHTFDPRLGCLRLAELVRPGGAMSVWVYPPEYWGLPVQRTVGRLLHRTLSRLSHDASLRICERWLYPLGRVQMRLAHRRWSKVLAAPVFLCPVPRHPHREVMISTIYDHYGPTIVTTHTAEEVRGWLEDAGFAVLRPVPVPTAWLGVKPDGGGGGGGGR